MLDRITAAYDQLKTTFLQPMLTNTTPQQAPLLLTLDDEHILESDDEADIVSMDQEQEFQPIPYLCEFVLTVQNMTTEEAKEWLKTLFSKKETFDLLIKNKFDVDVIKSYLPQYKNTIQFYYELHQNKAQKKNNTAINTNILSSNPAILFPSSRKQQQSAAKSLRQSYSL